MPAIVVILVCSIGCEHSQPAQSTVLDAYRAEFPDMDALATQAQIALRAATSTELVFLVPDEHYSPPTKEPNTEYFHWWKVTGRQLLDDQQRSKVASDLVSDIEAHRRKPYADCFEPRHALRVTNENGDVLDIVLCFRCEQLWCFDNSGKRLESQTVISKQLESILDSMKKNPSP